MWILLIMLVAPLYGQEPYPFIFSETPSTENNRVADYFLEESFPIQTYSPSGEEMEVIQMGFLEAIMLYPAKTNHYLPNGDYVFLIDDSYRHAEAVWIFQNKSKAELGEGRWKYYKLAIQLSTLMFGYTTIARKYRDHTPWIKENFPKENWKDLGVEE